MENDIKENFDKIKKMDLEF